jgi:uncharacterized RDD family membrane protein YckC
MSQPPDPNALPPDPNLPPTTPPPASPPPGAQPPYQPAPPPAPGYGYGQGGPAVPPGMHYDVASELTLPDGVELASVGRRIGAYFLAIPLSIVTLVIGYLIWGLIVWGRGQTPALQVLKMRCWEPEERRVPGWGRMALREVVGRFIIEGLIPFVGLISLIIFLTSKQRKAIHDYVAGTVVLHDSHDVLKV